MDVLSSSARSGQRWCAIAASFFLALPASVALGDGEREQSLKAGYVFNFVRYVEWPAQTFSDPNDALQICFYGEGLPADAFDSLKGRSVRDIAQRGGARRDARVRHLADAADIPSCQVLFVGGASPPTATHPLLTVGDAAGFARSGGVIGLVKQKNRIAFSINLAVAEGRGLKIRSGLLNLATNVIR